MTLLDRSTRSVSVTPEGECLLEYVRRAVTELDTGLNRVKTMRKRYRGRVRVACVPSLAGTRLPQVIARYQSDYPLVQVEVFELLAKPVYEAVRRKIADVGIGPVGASIEGLNSEVLFTEPICAVFPETAASRTARVIALKDLEGLPVMTVGSNTMQLDLLASAQLASGVRLKITHQVAQAQTLLRMVSAGLGVAIVPSVAMEGPGYDSLHAYPIVSPPLNRDVAILTKKENALSSVATRFAEVLKETIASSK